MTDLRVAFFGSPDFAVPSLRALIHSDYRPVVVVTQPDRPAGRGRIVQPPPAKVEAAAAGIPVLQPARLRDPDAVAALAACAPDLQIVAAYGQILPPSVLALPRHGTLNLHASLLPRWRGASPIAAAIRAGDRETGVTIMLVDEGEDTGPILALRREPIRDSDDAATLSARLAEIGAALLLETLPAWLQGRLRPQPQDPALATRARRLRKEDGAIDWTQPAEAIWRQIRAMTPSPGATTTLRGQPLRLLRAHVESGGAAAEARPGTILRLGHAIVVQAGEGAVALEQVQKAGKRAVGARAFANGERHLLGARLGAADADA